MREQLRLDALSLLKGGGDGEEDARDPIRCPRNGALYLRSYPSTLTESMEWILYVNATVLHLPVDTYWANMYCTSSHMGIPRVTCCAMSCLSFSCDTTSLLNYVLLHGHTPAIYRFSMEGNLNPSIGPLWLSAPGPKPSVSTSLYVEDSTCAEGSKGLQEHVRK